MARKSVGIEIQGKSIRLLFTWRGKHRCKTLVLAPSPPKIKHDERLVAEIRRKIEIGLFDYAAYFPDAPNAKGPATGSSTFKQICDDWLKVKGRLASAAPSKYGNALIFL